jgi:hypothetical protein
VIPPIDFLLILTNSSKGYCSITYSYLPKGKSFFKNCSIVQKFKWFLLFNKLLVCKKWHVRFFTLILMHCSFLFWFPFVLIVSNLAPNYLKRKPIVYSLQMVDLFDWWLITRLPKKGCFETSFKSCKSFF